MMLHGLGSRIADSPACPGAMLDPASGTCMVVPEELYPYQGGRIQPYQITDQGSGIDTGATLALNTAQTLPGAQDAGMIQTMVGAGAPGIPISPGVAYQQPAGGMSTWILPGIIGLVALYAVWKWRAN